MTPFTESEVAAMQKWPEALRALADWHDYQETMADAMDSEVFAPQIKHHSERRKELRAEADRIEREAEAAENRALGVGVDAAPKPRAHLTSGKCWCQPDANPCNGTLTHKDGVAGRDGETFSHQPP